jgi:uncharacterized protein (TIGR02145 family)
MKKIIFSLIGICTLFTSNAQSNMVIHQGNGSILSLPLQSIDSVRFILVPSPVTKKIFQNNGNILSLSVADIDSITYKIPNRSSLPTISSQTVSVLSSSSAFGGGNITADGGSAVTQRGVCWNISPNPTIANNLTYDGSGMGNFNSTILPLTPNTTYYLRAYATNANGTSYGNQISFVTNTANNSGSLPTISSDNIDFYKYFGLFSGGNITNDGGLAVTARGICWATGTTPNINYNRTNDGAGVGNFISRLDNLLPNTQYFVRAYATNDAGTAYGNSFAFNTSDFPELFTDTFKSITYCLLPFNGGTRVGINTVKYTQPIYDIGFNDVKIRFPKHISSSGYSEYGIVWSKTINPKISGNKKSIVEELIVQLPVNECGFSVINGVRLYYPKYILDSSITISNLEKGVEYFVRFYAKNSKGTIYSKNYNFNTLSGIPSVKINKINYITAKTANIPFEITSTNGSVINKIDVLISQNKNTGFVNDELSDNPPINQLIDWYLTQLKPSTKYYFKIFFETNMGTYYSSVDSFTTVSEFMYQAGQGVTFNGHNYKTIILGNGQEWFKENLKTSIYSNGDPILKINNLTDWNSTSNGAWVYYNNDSSNNNSIGKLYNYYSITESRNICPIGWHIPTQNDWDNLLSFINPSIDKNCSDCWIGAQAIQLKIDNSSFWSNINYANNESGFSALPGGLINETGFSSIENGIFGTSTYDTDKYTIYLLRNDNLNIARILGDKKVGSSIRCIKN